MTAGAGLRLRLWNLLYERGWDVRRWPHAATGPGILKDLLARRGITTVLDVGANEGQYATLLRRVGFTGRIISYEPVPDVAAALRTRASADPAWEVVDVALGARSGTLRLNRTVGSDLVSALDPVPFAQRVLGQNAEVVGHVDVPVRRLDEVWPADPDDTVLLKLDTQGYDLEVLKGAERSLEAVDVVQTELSFLPLYRGMPHALEVMEWLADQGFP